MKNPFPWLLLLFAVSLPALGRDIYVSTSGSDSSSGNSGSPYRTIQKGITSAAAGDTINVKAGTYVERLSISKSGTAASPITLRSDPANGGTYPLIDGTTLVPTANNDLSALLTITNSNYVTVQGLEFANYATSNASAIPCGVHIQGSGTGIKILSNKIHHIWQTSTSDANGFGFVVYGSSGTSPVDQLLVDGNQVWDLKTGSSESFTLNGNVTNFTVTNNIVHDGNNIGMDFIGYEGTASSNDYARNGLVRGNVVYNIDTINNPSYGGERSAAGLYVDGGSYITMERNEVYNCNYGIEIASEHSGKYATYCVVRDNLVRGNQVGGIIMGGYAASKGGIQNCSFTNNTLYKNDTTNAGGGNIEVQHHASTTVIKQNLIVCGTSTEFVQIDSSDNTFTAGSIDYNLYSGVSSGSADFKWAGSDKNGYSSWQSSSGQDAHSTFVTASTGLFIKSAPAVAADFALISTSPAKDKGSASFAIGSGETDFFGNARISATVDVGMAEYGGLAPALRVEYPAGTALAYGGTASFGTVVVPASATKTFTLINTGTANLTGLTITKDGTNAGEFAVSALTAAPPLLPAGSVTFDVTFTPATEGTRTATLHIASNDPTHATFNIVLSGTAQLLPNITSAPLQPKTVNPGAAVSFSVTATGTKTITYQWRKDSQNIPGATAATYSIAKATEANEGNYDVVVTNPAGSVTSNTVLLSINDPVVLPVLAPQSGSVGGAATFSITPTSGTPPFTYQWRKNGVNIAGATSDSLVLTNVSLASSATYSVLVGNAVGAVASSGALLNVGDTMPHVYKLPTGGKAVMTASFAGTFTSFVWTKNGAALPADSRYVGGNTKTLTINLLRNASPDDSGMYQCIGASSSGNLAAMAQLIVYSSAPLLPAGPLAMPGGAVGAFYPGFTVPFDGSASRTPTLFGAVGLPVGLTINTATGLISGKPAVALTADHTYSVKLTAANAKGTASVMATLVIKALPAGTTGTFAGPVAREAVLNKSLGGRVDATVATTGAFTAKAVMGALTYNFVGTLAVDPAGAVLSHGTALLKRTAPLPALTLDFDIDTTHQKLVNAHVTDGAAVAAFDAWRYDWASTATVAEISAVKPLMGYYTFGMTIPADQVGVEAVPQGMSYGSFTVAATGAVTVVGRLADGTTYACTTFCGPHGEILLYQALYASLGSVRGNLQLTAGTGPGYLNNSLAGNVDWLRPRTATHIYAAGFGPLALTPYGGRYLAPAAGHIVMDLANLGTASNAALAFAQGGIADTTTSPGIDLRVASPAVVTRPTTNPDLTTLVINAATGAFSGSFRLTDPNLITPGGAAVVRTSSYFGMLVKGPQGWQCGGYFLLPKRPQVAPQTLLTTDVLSGMVELQAK